VTVHRYHNLVVIDEGDNREGTRVFGEQEVLRRTGGPREPPDPPPRLLPGVAPGQHVPIHAVLAVSEVDAVARPVSALSEHLTAAAGSSEPGVLNLHWDRADPGGSRDAEEGRGRVPADRAAVPHDAAKPPDVMARPFAEAVAPILQR
jgi:hypothetical protein